MAYSQFHDGFWTDPEIRGLSSDDKLILIWFITNPYRHYSGLYFFEFDSISKQTGLPEKTVVKGIDTLLEQKFIKHNPKFSVVWVIKMARHEVIKSEKTGFYSKLQTKGIANHLETLHKCPLIGEFLAFYEDMEIPYRYGIRQEEEEEKEEEEAKEEKKAKAPADTPPPKSKKIKVTETSLPEGFGISEAVQKWAAANGHTRLEEHLEAFRDWALSKGKTYVDWDSTFRRFIREDWGKIRQGGGFPALPGQQHQPMSRAEQVTAANLKAAREAME